MWCEYIGGLLSHDKSSPLISSIREHGDLWGGFEESAVNRWTVMDCTRRLFYNWNRNLTRPIPGSTQIQAASKTKKKNSNYLYPPNVTPCSHFPSASQKSVSLRSQWTFPFVLCTTNDFPIASEKRLIRAAWEAKDRGRGQPGWEKEKGVQGKEAEKKRGGKRGKRGAWERQGRSQEMDRKTHNVFVCDGG